MSWRSSKKFLQRQADEMTDLEKMNTVASQPTVLSDFGSKNFNYKIRNIFHKASGTMKLVNLGDNFSNRPTTAFSS